MARAATKSTEAISGMAARKAAVGSDHIEIKRSQNRVADSLDYSCTHRRHDAP